MTNTTKAYWHKTDGGRKFYLADNGIKADTKEMGDCVVRAFCVYLEEDYCTMYYRMYDEQPNKKPCTGVYNHVIDDIAAEEGMKTVYFNEAECFRNVAEMGVNGILLAKTHVAVALDGKLWDDWDSGEYDAYAMIVKENDYRKVTGKFERAGIC